MEGPIAQVWYLHYPLAGPATVFLNNWTVKPRGVKIEDPLTPKPSSMLILDFKMKYGEFLNCQAQHNRFQQQYHNWETVFKIGARTKRILSPEPSG